MERLQTSQILVNASKVGDKKFDSTSAKVITLINDTKEKQAAIRKLLQLDQEKLKMAVQL